MYSVHIYLMNVKITKQIEELFDKVLLQKFGVAKSGKLIFYNLFKVNQETEYLYHFLPKLCNKPSVDVMIYEEDDVANKMKEKLKSFLRSYVLASTVMLSAFNANGNCIISSVKTKALKEISLNKCTLGDKLWKNVCRSLLNNLYLKNWTFLTT